MPDVGLLHHHRELRTQTLVFCPLDTLSSLTGGVASAPFQCSSDCFHLLLAWQPQRLDFGCLILGIRHQARCPLKFWRTPEAPLSRFALKKVPPTHTTGVDRNVRHTGVFPQRTIFFGLFHFKRLYILDVGLSVPTPFGNPYFRKWECSQPIIFNFCGTRQNKKCPILGQRIWKYSSQKKKCKWLPNIRKGAQPYF